MSTPKTVRERRVDPIGFAPIVEENRQATGFFATQWNRLVDYVYSLAGIERDIAFLENAEIIAGSGLDGGGLLKDSPITLTADAQEILDQITTTHGSVVYRGAAAWQALAPGTLGYLLSTNGSGADPSWIVPPTGGGGGGTYFNGASGVPTGVSTTALATKGTVFVPREDITIYAVWAVYDSAGAGQSHRCVIADINTVAGGVIQSVLGTTNAYNAIDTNVRAVRFDFATPVTMLANIPYVVCLTNASGIGTTVCRVTDIAQSATSASAFWEMNAPGDSEVQVHDYNTLTLSALQTPTASASTVQHGLWLEAEFGGGGGGGGLAHGDVMVRVSLGF